MKNKIMLLFPDGVGIRNYLYSGVFANFEEELVLFHDFDVQTEKTILDVTNIKESYTIPKYKETVKEKFLRELICLSRLKYNAKKVGNPILLTHWKTNYSGIFKKLFYKVTELVSIGVTQYKTIEKLEKQYQKEIRKTAFYKEIKTTLMEIAPKQLFCSHQRGVQCGPIFAAAADLGIKTITAIYSWDNLPKARMALRADQYLVWSDHMKQEMAIYYPEINQEKVLITGTPQFECYNNLDNIIAKEEFYEKYSLENNKKIICFSGDDLLTSPDDPKYLNDLAEELILKGMDKDYQILLRRCPVDISGRFDTVIKKYPGLIKQAPPLWNFEKNSSWTTIYPLLADRKLLISTVFYCDIVVNVGSTMAFDFAIFKKPCIFINYDQETKEDSQWSVKFIYQLQHFRSMPTKEVVSWWSKKEDIGAILQNSKFNHKMEEWNNIVLADYKNAVLKINNLIKNP